MDVARDRLRELVKQNPKLNLRTLSRQLKKNDAYLHQYLDRKSPRHLPEDVRYRLAALLGVHEAELRSYQPETSSIPDVIDIPWLDVEVSAGHGASADDAGLSAEDDRKSWLFDRRSLAQITSGPHHRLRMLNVRGDSMQPVLDDGDVILVNTDDLLPSPPGIFVLFDGMGVMAKRVEMIPSSEPVHIRISSANTHYSSYQRKLEDITILGRVIWFGRKLVTPSFS